MPDQAETVKSITDDWLTRVPIDDIETRVAITRLRGAHNNALRAALAEPTEAELAEMIEAINRRSRQRGNHHPGAGPDHYTIESCRTKARDFLEVRRKSVEAGHG